MSKTKIAWTDETANWIVGCTKTRAKGAKESGCDNCYAELAAASARLQQFDQYKTVIDENGKWNGHVEFVPKVLDDLLKGKRKRQVFTPSMSDPFHPNVKDESLDHFMAVVALTPNITYQVLTKRPKRMPEYMRNAKSRIRVAAVDLGREKNIEHTDIESCQWEWPLPNLWLGVSVENQAAANERIPLLLQTPAAIRFLSVEPLFEPIDLIKIGHPHPLLQYWCQQCEAVVKDERCWLCGSKSKQRTDQISQVIIGGESGSNARPFHLEWARSLIDQCCEAGVKVFMKQVGSNAFYEGMEFKTKSRSGADMSEWPEWAQIQEFPEVK